MKKHTVKLDYTKLRVRPYGVYTELESIDDIIVKLLGPVPEEGREFIGSIEITVHEFETKLSLETTNEEDKGVIDNGTC